jgi:N-acetylglucosaminyl-diphospho-decaprenol L-rhamnosyltransferase
MNLSIVIVNWNTRDLLEQCLRSVFMHPPQGDFEVWVVDNASNDGSREMVQERFPSVHLLANNNNPGFAHANNQAIRQTCGKYILLLNPDTVVLPGALERLVKFMDETPDAGGAGSRLLNPDRTLQVSCYPRPTLFREFWRMFHLDAIHHLGTYPMRQWSLETNQEVDVLMGACLILRCETFTQVGYLDEDYFIYSEEVDLCYRVQQAGWRLYWVPQAQVIHYGGQSTQLVAQEMFLRLYQGKVLYFRKHYGGLAAQIYKLILYAASLWRLVLTPLVILEKPSQRQQHLTLSTNYWRLIEALPGL